MVKIILGVLSLLVMLSCSTAVKENTTQPDIMETNKKNLGNLLALYPKPMTVVGAEVEGKVNWLVVVKVIIPIKVLKNQNDFPSIL